MLETGPLQPEALALYATMGYARSRSTLQDATNGAQPGQSTFTASLTSQLATNLTAQIVVQRSQSDSSSTGGAGRSNSLSISLKYDGPSFDASR